MNENLTLIEEAQPQRDITVMSQHAPAAPENSPVGMMLSAMSKGATLEQVSQMMDLQERWEKREAEKAFNESFAAFKAEAVRIVKNRSVTDGPLKGKKYAELFAVVNAITPALSAHGLSASWKLTRDEKDWIEVTCSIKHTRGHMESVSMGGPPDTGGAKNAIQARASTVSYLERYTLKAITGLSEQEDDNDGDGGAGSGDTGTPDPLIDAGNQASGKGMKALTEWWGGLTAKQRGGLNKEFAAMRKVAASADREAGRA